MTNQRPLQTLVCAIALGLAGGALADVNEQERERAKTLCEAGVMSAAECAGLHATVLPGVGSDGLTLPLTADQLDPAERKTFAALPAGSADARQFLHTRGYLRYCKQVADGTRAPLDLPPLPKRENWNRKFLSKDEATKVVDVALSKNITAQMPPPQTVPPIDPAIIAAHALPAIDADGRTEALTAGQLTPDEKATFASLEPGSTKAKQYLYVRGYLRYCRLLLAGTIAPLQLPGLPARENWDRKLLTESEARDVLDVALAKHLIALMSPAPGK